MNIINKKLLVFFVSLICMIFLGCPKYYAVLISTNNVVLDDQSIHSEWWYDLFLQYKMLRDLGYTDQNIYVLYGNGNDFNTTHKKYNTNVQYGHAITDYPCNKTQIQNIFKTLSSRLNKDDYLYIWWMGHGGGSGPGMCNLTMSIHHTGEAVTDVEFTSYLNSITRYKKRWVNVMTCHSGGLVDNINNSGNRTITFTSCTCAQLSYDKSGSCDYVHAEFNYDEPTAYLEKDPCNSAVTVDNNSDGVVHVDEAFNYISSTMTRSTPQKADPDNIASTSKISVK
jgi:hypothetical protein